MRPESRDYVMLPKHASGRSAIRKFISCIRKYSTPVTTPNALNAFIGNSDQFQDAVAGEKGLLTGKPIAIKDNIVTTSHPTSAASEILAGYQSPFDATVVKLLRQHGAIISAKTNLDEFGMGSHSQNSAAGAVKSLFSRAGVPLSPGGSSGGGAVAVATGQCWAALGTDTGGSVRLPAAYTGVVGLKPTYGRLSRWGVIQYANSLDTVGVLSRAVGDARRVFEAVDQYDEQDPTSLSMSFRSRTRDRAADARKSLRIGIPLEYNVASLSRTVRSVYTRTLLALQSIGHSLHPISLSTTERALSAYYVLAPAEASSNLAKYDGIRYGYRTPGTDASPAQNLPLYAQTRGEGFGEEVKRRILLGAYTLSSEAIDNYFVQAQKVRRLVQQDFDRVFTRPNPLLDPPSTSVRGVDILLTPTAPTLPPTIDEAAQQSALESYMNDMFTVPASLAGLPALSLPVALTLDERRGMEEHDVRSVGMQVLGQFGDDELVLQAGEMVEGLSRP
nr:glutamyl-trna(gln) amidotransferase subunit a, mitochondrial [Quercus suber]